MLTNLVIRLSTTNIKSLKLDKWERLKVGCVWVFLFYWNFQYVYDNLCFLERPRELFNGPHYFNTIVAYIPTI